MVIVECFKHWRHYLKGSQHTIEVWSDHQNLQGFMKQPKVNGRQARWLVYLTPYDFIIYHRPGILNPANGPSRRPDYMAQAQREPSLLLKDLLAKRLAESDSWVTDIPINPETETESRLKEPYRSGLLSPLDVPKYKGVAPTLSENQVGSITSQISSPPDVPLYKAVAPTLVAPDWVGSCAADSEAGHLLELVRIQTVTRQEAKRATQNENPLGDNVLIGLLD